MKLLAGAAGNGTAGQNAPENMFCVVVFARALDPPVAMADDIVELRALAIRAPAVDVFGCCVVPGVGLVSVAAKAARVRACQRVGKSA